MPEHQFYTTPSGKRDDRRNDMGSCYGPVCRVCGHEFCVVCHPHSLTSYCPGPRPAGGQTEVTIGELNNQGAMAIGCDGDVVQHTRHTGPVASPLRMSRHTEAMPRDRSMNMVLARAAWLGRTGTVYAHDDPPGRRERGGFAPLYLQLGIWVNDDGLWIIKD